MRGELLWVYEGLTNYLGDILAARSGLWTPDQYRDNLAYIAAYLSRRPGRKWRPLVDTTVAAQLLYESSAAWASWRRSVDFYDEGELLWLEADVLIRQQTQGKKSLDDFTHLFHGGQSGPPMLKTYTFDDVVAALNQVTPYDWRKFLADRVNAIDDAPLGGIVGGGWRLVYDDNPGELMQARSRKQNDASFSIGLILNESGGISDAIYDSPAYKAGIGPGMKVVAVNGRRYSPEVLTDALRAGRNNPQAPLELLVENGELFTTYRVDYHDGPRFPHLVRDAGKPDVLAEIIKQHAQSVPAK
jgi:predicted metalloprotease with PDZ domain